MLARRDSRRPYGLRKEVYGNAHLSKEGASNLRNLFWRQFMKRLFMIAPIVAGGLYLASSLVARAGEFNFTTGNPDGLIATATRPPSAGKVETETADDFVVTQQTILTSASFTGLITSATGTTSFNIPRVSI